MPKSDVFFLMAYVLVFTTVFTFGFSRDDLIWDVFDKLCNGGIKTCLGVLFIYDQGFHDIYTLLVIIGVLQIFAGLFRLLAYSNERTRRSASLR
jgi:hypothetical protein